MLYPATQVNMPFKVGPPTKVCLWYLGWVHLCQFFHFSGSGAPSPDISHLGIKSCLYAREDITTPGCLQGKIAKTIHPILMAQCSRMGLHCHIMLWCHLSISSWCHCCISAQHGAAFLHGAGLHFCMVLPWHFCMVLPWHFCMVWPWHFYVTLPLHYLRSSTAALFVQHCHCHMSVWHHSCELPHGATTA